MKKEKVEDMKEVLYYIESRLHGRLEMDAAAKTVHYSKYYFHRMFSETVGMTFSSYVCRRRLTEAARLLTYSDMPVLEIALQSGYNSQQAFTEAFRAMYKVPPGRFRDKKKFYPLQLPLSLWSSEKEEADTAQIGLAANQDIPLCMELARLVVDGYPCFEEKEYAEWLKQRVSSREVLILKSSGKIFGMTGFCAETGMIEFMGVHPQYRKGRIQSRFLETLKREHLSHQEIGITTYRKNDRADTGYRKELKELGFTEGKLLKEFGYPTQQFILPL